MQALNCKITAYNCKIVAYKISQREIQPEQREHKLWKQKQDKKKKKKKYQEGAITTACQRKHAKTNRKRSDVVKIRHNQNKKNKVQERKVTNEVRIKLFNITENC